MMQIVNIAKTLVAQRKAWAMSGGGILKTQTRQEATSLLSLLREIQSFQTLTSNIEQLDDTNGMLSAHVDCVEEGLSIAIEGLRGINHELAVKAASNERN